MNTHPIAARIKRQHQIKIILSTEEKTMLGEIRMSTGLTASDFLRQQIRHSHAALPNGQAPAKATSRRRPAKKKARARRRR
jgi:hypothetical protein